MWTWHDGGDGWGVLWMGLMMAIVWVPLLLVFVWALREFGRPREDDRASMRGPVPEPAAGEIARRAYARGEIDRERYLQVMDDLRVNERKS